MAGRFRILADEPWSRGHIQAIRSAGWEVVRVVDAVELGQGTPDPAVLTYCAEHGYVWMTTDQRAQAHIAQWLKAGSTLPGIVIAVQRHRITPGRLLGFLEDLAAEDAPFAGVIRFVRPEQ